MKTPKLTIPFGDVENSPVHEISFHNDWPDTDRSVKAQFRIAYDNDALNILFTTSEAPILCRHFGDQAAVSCDSCVEAFIQPAEGGEYWNVEVNVGESINCSHRIERPKATKLSSAELAQIKRQSSMKINGDTSIPGNGNSWTMRLSIPWQLMGVTPHKGMTMRGNFYACASEAQPPYYLSWAPIATDTPQYHRPEFFGELTLD